MIHNLIFKHFSYTIILKNRNLCKNWVRWLILCVNLPGHGVPGLNINSECFWECFQIRLAFESMDSINRLHSPVWASSNPLRAWIEQGRGKRIYPIFTASLLNRDILFHLLLPSDWDLYHWLSWFSGLQSWTLWVNYRIGLPRSPRCRWQIMGLCSLCICPIINLHFIHRISYCSVSLENSD